MRIPSSKILTAATVLASEHAPNAAAAAAPKAGTRQAADVFAPAPARTDKPTPLPPNLPLEAYDGALMARDGTMYPPGTRPEDIEGFKPRDGRAPNGLAVYINGVCCLPSSFDWQAFADGTGAEVVPLYNATQGVLKDATQVLLDSLDRGTNKAVDSLSSMVYERLKSGDPVRLIAHSQGALIASRALQDVKDRLIGEGMSKADAEKLLGKATVETFGGAARKYPDGPRYVHYVNRFDPVTLISGWITGRNGPGIEPGRGAKVVEFWDWSLKPWLHNPLVYAKHYQPLE